jgi:glyoxylase I family protein
MINLKGIHHIAVICSDYKASKAFYTETLGLTVKAEHYRADRRSYKLDLCVGDQYLIELFSFENPPKRPTRPEAAGLRHLAFAVENVEASELELKKRGVVVEPIRIDEFTGKKFTFFADPDGLPIEIYEA